VTLASNDSNYVNDSYSSNEIEQQVMIEESIRYREKMGLNANADYVENLVNKLKLQPSKTFGVVLTPEEENSPNERFVFQEFAKPRISQYISKN
jgi:hypothetical protein